MPKVKPSVYFSYDDEYSIQRVPSINEINRQEYVLFLDLRIQMTSLTGIEKLVNLERLYCEYNQLTSLDGIQGLTSLKILSFPMNKVTKLPDFIMNFKNLEYIDYSGNPIEDISDEMVEFLGTVKDVRF